MEDTEPFLARWSRRKLKAKENAPAVPQTAEPPAVASAPAIDAAAPGPAPELGPQYAEYFDPRVDEKLRQTALRELFRDPHFNVMDGLDTYIDDYSLPDPIPAAMLRRLNQAKELFLFEDEKQADEREGKEALAAPVEAAAAPPVAGNGAGSLPAPEAVAATAEDAAAAQGAGAAPAAAEVRNS